MTLETIDIEVLEEVLEEKTIGNLNVLIMGQTGVGKSSLINYIFDEDIRETGTGKPVTPKVFEGEFKKINDIPVTLIDSWGLEQGKDEEWQSLLNDFMKNHSTEQKVENWVHVVLFCINASSNRIQDFEINIINDFLSKNMEVVVALTKSALCSPDTLTEMKDALQKETNGELTVVPVNSKKETLFGGMEIQQFGRDEISKAMRGNYLNMLRLRLPERMDILLKNKLQAYAEEIKECKKTNDAIELATQYSKSFWQEDIEQTIQSELRDALTSYVQVHAITINGKEYEREAINYKTIINRLTQINKGSTDDSTKNMLLNILSILKNKVNLPVLTIATAATLYKSISGSPADIAEEFLEMMHSELLKNQRNLDQVVLQMIEKTEKQFNQSTTANGGNE